MKLSRHITILTMIIILAAASAIAQRSRPTPDYFPLEVGNFWKYRHNEGNEFTFSIVSSSKQVDGSTLYLMDKAAGTKVLSSYTHANGLVILRKDAYPEHEGLEVTFEPPKQVLKNPLKRGETWTWRGKSVTQGDAIESSKVIGAERVVVPAGKFRAMKVVSVIADGGASRTVTAWYVDGVGLVKSWTEAGQIKYGWELIAYNSKGSSPKKGASGH